MTLLFLLLAASGSMMLTVVLGLADGDRSGCELAAGADPSDPSWTQSARTVGQAVAYRLCQSVWEPPPPWWQLVGWPLLLTASAVLLFLLLPRWKARAGRVVPLAAVDPDGEVDALVAELAGTTGLATVPRVVVDPAAGGSGAVVFGRTGRPVVRLQGGLLVDRHRDPVRFRAVLLHELAHVANRDITLTYATITLWRVFLALVLLPYLLWEGHVVHGVLADGRMPVPDRPMLLAAFTVTLVHLARSDVLRSREVYADLTALRWGADPGGWAGGVPQGAAGPVPRAHALTSVLAPVLALLRTHPQWSLRRSALSDPAPLFRTHAAAFFLTGATVVLVDQHLLYYLAPYNLATIGITQAITLLSAALVTAIAGVSLWRTVAYAVLTGARVPSGLWAGGWLGAGIAAGTVLTSSGGSGVWVPQRPQILLLPVAVGLAYGWWLTQCAHLWTRTRRGRSLRPALLISLGAVVPALGLWLAWWHLMGILYASGFTARAAGVAQWVYAWFPTATPGDDPGRVPGIATVLPLLGSITAVFLIPLALTLLWVVPLIAWAAGPAKERPGRRSTEASADPAPGGDLVPAPGVGGPAKERPDRRSARASLDPPQAGALVPAPGVAVGEGVVPPLRRVLLPGLLGAVVACVAFAGVQAYLHTGRPVAGDRGGLYALRYTAGTLLALAAPAGLAALVAGFRTGRFRLLGSLIAAQSTVLLGFFGVTVLASLDGCAGPLAVLQDSCSWRPAWQLRLFPYLYVLNVALVLATVLATLPAGVGAAAAAALRRVRPARPREAAAPAPGRGTRGRRVAAGVLCAAALGLSGTADVSRMPALTFTVDVAAAQNSTAQLAAVPDAPVSAATRARQVNAWYGLGGDTVLDRLFALSDQLTTALRAPQGGSWDALDRRLRPICEQWGRAGLYEAVWFRVPDRETQADWHSVAVHAAQGGPRCTAALSAHDQNALLSALRELVAAGRCTASVNARIDAVLRADGRRGTVRTQAQGTACERAG
ncbi:M48 family metalloprotease [Streptomyces sp. NPDC056387]|uniref:M48 family metalloprotease n=1 Tax=Streptomyces sp. NPDC056387 TaxID=3345803 RepID=UPI0035D7BF56